MITTALKRQFIRDASGKPIGVILPLEEFALVKPILEQRFPSAAETDKLHQIEKAVDDPLFMADLYETMSAFEASDADWWEQTE